MYVCLFISFSMIVTCLELELVEVHDNILAFSEPLICRGNEDLRK